jgi:hypothetical protein
MKPKEKLQRFNLSASYLLLVSPMAVFFFWMINFWGLHRLLGAEKEGMFFFDMLALAFSLLLSVVTTIFLKNRLFHINKLFLLIVGLVGSFTFAERVVRTYRHYFVDTKVGEEFSVESIMKTADSSYYFFAGLGNIGYPLTVVLTMVVLGLALLRKPRKP